MTCCSVNTLRPRQNGRHFPDDIFKCIFFNENIRISTKNSLKFVPQGFINNIPALVLIMAWRRPGDKPLSEPMMVSLLTHICVTRPHWVKWFSLCWKNALVLKHSCIFFYVLLQPWFRLLWCYLLSLLWWLWFQSVRMLLNLENIIKMTS